MSILNFIKRKLPYIVSLIIVIFILSCIKNVKKWEREDDVINWDVISYYGYLPATFIYHDISLKFTEDYTGPHKFTIWSSKAPNGANVIMTSMGMSILYSPFFFIAHGYAHIFNYEPTGYTEPYRLALILSSVFYLALGLFFLSKLLLKFFNPYISAWVVLITVIGTNLFFYVTYSSAMAHPYNFALITMFLWYTIKWYETSKARYAVFIGLLLGLISLIRPTNIVVGLFFVFWDVKNLSDITNRLHFFLKNYKTHLLITFLILLVWLPQFIYWKSLTGSFLYYSYGENNKFFFNQPMILKGLIGYRHGWLVYSPAMIFSVLGLFILIKKNKGMALPVILTFLVFIYVIFSWWCWWYGGAFGMRAMIDIYGLMALPLGAFFTYALNWRKIWLYLSVFLSVILVAASVHHTNKFRHYSIHYDSMTKEAFWDSYFSIRPSPTFESKLKTPDYEKARLGIEAYIDNQK